MGRSSVDYLNLKLLIKIISVLFKRMQIVYDSSLIE